MAETTGPHQASKRFQRGRSGNPKGKQKLLQFATLFDVIAAAAAVLPCLALQLGGAVGPGPTAAGGRGAAGTGGAGDDPDQQRSDCPPRDAAGNAGPGLGPRMWRRLWLAGRHHIPATARGPPAPTAPSGPFVLGVSQLGVGVIISSAGAQPTTPQSVPGAATPLLGTTTVGSMTLA